MQIGSGCTVHLRADELPSGRLVVSVSKHLTAVIDGVIHDAHDPSPARNQMCLRVLATCCWLTISLHDDFSFIDSPQAAT
jgi:hypothetical protein